MRAPSRVTALPSPDVGGWSASLCTWSKRSRTARPLPSGVFHAHHGRAHGSPSGRTRWPPVRSRAASCSITRVQRCATLLVRASGSLPVWGCREECCGQHRCSRVRVSTPRPPARTCRGVGSCRVAGYAWVQLLYTWPQFSKVKLCFEVGNIDCLSFSLDPRATELATLTDTRL